MRTFRSECSIEPIKARTAAAWEKLTFRASRWPWSRLSADRGGSWTANPCQVSQYRARFKVSIELNWWENSMGSAPSLKKSEWWDNRSTDEGLKIEYVTGR